MNIDKITGCLILNVYEFTADEIGKFRHFNKHNGMLYMESIMPEFVIRKEGVDIDYTDYYLQFIDRGTEKYKLFDVIGTDSITEEEINTHGFCETFNKTGLKNLLLDVEGMTYEQYKRIIPVSTIIKTRITVECVDEYECELFVDCLEIL